MKIPPDNMPDLQELLASNTPSDRNRMGDRNRNDRSWRDSKGQGGRNTPRGAQRGRKTQRGRRGHEDDTPVEPLQKSENRYKPTKKEDLSQAVTLKRNINSILNKLTPEKFDTLVRRFREEVPINDLETLKIVVGCVFEKSLLEASFCPTYANFSKSINENGFQCTTDGQKQYFKRLLLNQCQKEFESHARLPPDADKKIRATKKGRLLGTIRFIGELYIRKMATVRIIKECLTTLLGDRPNEKDLEALSNC